MRSMSRVIFEGLDFAGLNPAKCPQKNAKPIIANTTKLALAI